MFRFESVWLLILILPVSFAVWWMSRRRHRGDARLALPMSGLVVRQAISPWVYAERTLPFMRGMALAMIVVALARPQAGSTIENVSTLGVDIVIALDISSSMKAEDFQPNRLEVARSTAERFINSRDPDRIGLVAFAGLASTRCPLTLDHAMLRQFLDQVDFAPREQDGTALGMGLATAVNRLRKSEAKSKVVVLVTDGVNNKGEIGPKAAAEAARALGIKVYTVGVGSDEEVAVPIDDAFGRRYVMHKFDLDEELLQEIASLTSGRYFRAQDNQALREVFGTIDTLEKTKIESRMRMLYRELFGFPLLPAVGLLLLERFLRGTRLRRIP